MNSSRMPGEHHPYLDAAYAEALCDFGKPLEVAPWGSWVLCRSIGVGSFVDAIGLYPLMSLAPTADIAAGRHLLQTTGLVSLVGVADPFVSPPLTLLSQEFEVCRPFKDHAIIDRQIGPPEFTKHHRNKIRRALRSCVVDRVQLRDHLDRWIELYDELVRRWNITGIQRFSRRYFEGLASIRNLGCFAARQDGMIVAMTLWLRSDRIGYYHLGASSAAGYDISASYALHAASIEEYGDCDVLDLGGVAGLSDAGGGLARFKRGFANSSVNANLCGMILDHRAYSTLAADVGEGHYFPAYRAPGGARET
jgi:hypothetical protein